MNEVVYSEAHPDMSNRKMRLISPPVIINTLSAHWRESNGRVTEHLLRFSKMTLMNRFFMSHRTTVSRLRSPVGFVSRK